MDDNYYLKNICQTEHLFIPWSFPGTNEDRIELSSSIVQDVHISK